ncbi:MAG: VCBS repeat-containing protein [Candidatus Krumholzibacteria bacterium]|jgi:hypothetical protein|nr:VCBS repeat-containing protein [Candidatus Krumholzibacteria bacterium]MDP6668711.1 VCBS repeat-containing protein [Candidatus Krumholzibacteria bacterium]MDP6798045.1 VCBS repeat-containing protein [Candidatus Krumholzibacteria bacterium]MDP7022386.1 VCBS repeat-containing protein [Candidatus Krumholzibacteria bacterium]
MKAIALIPFLLISYSASAQNWVNQSYPWAFVEHHRDAEMIDDTRDAFVYGTDRGMLFFMERDRMTGKLSMKHQREVWAPVKEIRLAECTGDSRYELVVSTRQGDLFVINKDTRKDLWRTPEGYFETISCFTVFDADGDKKPEILLIADGKLVIMSGDTETEEYRSGEDYAGTRIAVADVDKDGDAEIVLNSGLVLDAKFRQLEWDFGESFGEEMDLFDIDGDGIVEIVGSDASGSLQIIDADDRKVKWE